MECVCVWLVSGFSSLDGIDGIIHWSRGFTDHRWFATVSGMILQNISWKCHGDSWRFFFPTEVRILTIGQDVFYQTPELYGSWPTLSTRQNNWWMVQYTGEWLSVLVGQDSKSKYNSPKTSCWWIIPFNSPVLVTKLPSNCLNYNDLTATSSWSSMP